MPPPNKLQQNAAQRQLLQKHNKIKPITTYGKIKEAFREYFNFEYLKFLIFDPAALPIISVLIILAEFMLNVIIVWRVPYTEIDWIAYMQECEGFLNGTTNYALLKGDTGPLVYPAGFVYIYTLFYYATNYGRQIRLGQYIFIGIYLLQMALVLRLYAKSRKVPPYVLIISAFTSYRIHSIYVLRLFNDPVAILFLYGALNLFMDSRWTLGSICFSMGVAVKMNVLLFAPALLLFYLVNLGFVKTIFQLFTCALVQLILGAPFLITYPVEYIKGSFDLGRIFEHKWTVNYRFLPKSIFENRYFHLALLVLHLVLLAALSKPTLTYFRNYIRLRTLQQQLAPQLALKNMELKQKRKEATVKKSSPNEEEELTPEQSSFLKAFEKSLQKSSGLKAPKKQTPNKAENEREPEVSIHFDQCTQLALLPFFVCNFIGIMCARSLHYQFYVWYFHSLPYLTWSTGYSLGLRYLLLGFIEFAWNTYPSTNFSSTILHVSHLVLFFGVAYNMYKTTKTSALIKEQQKNDASESSNGATARNYVNNKTNKHKTKTH